MAIELRGAKKGGGSSAKEAADSLHSIQSAQLVDLISEGEIEGLVNGLKSVYLDGVPVQNADGTLNFEGFNFAMLPGTQGQAPLPGFDTVQSERAVGVEVRHSTPVVQTVLSASVDAVRITISVPALTTLDTGSGDLNGGSFAFAIDIQSSGGGYVEAYSGTISGKTTSNYKRSIRLDLPGSAPWDIRLRRITADSTSSTVVNAFNWDSFTEIQSVALRYPNSAVAGIQVNARQFSRIPGRGFDILGLRIRVPTNYDPIAGTYSGIWDGTFKLAWTNNPAWVYFDVATHPRYGLGKYIKDGHFDKWQLYEIGRYCDVRVDDGQGGTEPRFSCNLYLQTEVQGKKLLEDLAGLFRAITFQGYGQIGVVQDAPADSRGSFTKANIVGEFSYQSVSRKTRHSVWTVYYNELAQLGKRVPLVYVSKDLVRQFGVVRDTFSPIGCTSRAQALRLARWAELSESMGRTVSFRAGADAVAVLPGHVIKISDPNKAGKRLGGRVRAATTAAVTLDAPVAIEAGQTYFLEVVMPDETVQLGYRTEKRQVTNAVGSHQVLNVSPVFTVAPLAATVWVLQPTNIQPTWWRVLGVKPVAGSNEYDVLGIAHDPDKFDAIENGLKLAPKPTSGLSVLAPAVAAVSLTETAWLDVATPRVKVTVSWEEPAPGLHYRVSWRFGLGSWTTLPDTSSNSLDIGGLQPGALEVAVQTINSLGAISARVVQTIALLGWTDHPGDVVELEAILGLDRINISWQNNAERLYRETEIRVGSDWDSAVPIFTGAASYFDWPWPAAGLYTLLARHRDRNDRESVTTAELDLDLTSLPADRKTLALTADHLAFLFDAAGAPTPSSITFTPTAVNCAGAPTFAITGGTLTGSGSTRSLAVADMTGDVASVTVTWDGLSDTVAVYKLRAGADAFTPILTNESAALAANAAGTLTVGYGAAAGTMQLWRGATQLTTGVVYSVASESGVDMTIDSSTGAYTASTLTADTAYATLRATYGGNNYDRQYKLSKVRAGGKGDKGDGGDPGLSSVVVMLYQRSTSGAPARPTDTLTYNFATGLLSGGSLAGWAQTIPGGSGPVYVTAATAASYGSTDVIFGSDWAGVQPGGNGSAATVTLYQRTTTNSAPAKPSGTLTYTFSTGVLSGSLGSWSQAFPAGTGSYLWAINATAFSNTDTDTIAGSEFSDPGMQSTRQAGWWYVNNSAGWNDVVAAQTVFARTGTSPIYNDIVTILDASGLATTKFWYPPSSQWFDWTNFISGSSLTAWAVTDIYTTVASGVGVSGLSGVPTGTWTDVHSWTFTAQLAGVCSVTTDDVATWTSSNGGFGGAYASGGRTRFVVGSQRGEIASFGSDGNDTSPTAHTKSFARTTQFDVTAGTSYTVQFQAQQAVYSQSMAMSGTMRIEVMKR